MKAKKLFFKSFDFNKSFKMRSTIIAKNMQKIQRYSSAQSQIYSLWSSQRPPVNVGVKSFQSRFYNFYTAGLRRRTNFEWDSKVYPVVELRFYNTGRKLISFLPRLPRMPKRLAYQQIRRSGKFFMSKKVEFCKWKIKGLRHLGPDLSN